ncbi:MAG: ATP-binding cassette domain-containing protein, partial [Bdellovibrionota bacterium]
KTIKGLSDRQLAELRRHHFGYIFQTFNLLPVLTALENVQMPLIRKGLGSEESLMMAYEVLDRVGLKSVVHQYPSQLSGGQKQRVAIARALAVKPKVILADEPTASLDATRAREILHLLQDLNVKDQKTIVFSTHDPEIMAMAKRLIYLRDGHIVNEEKK